MYVWRNPFYGCVSNGKWEVIIPLICHSDMEPCLGHCCCLTAYFAPPVVCFKAAILVQASLDTTTGPILFSWLLQGMSAVHPYFSHNRVSIWSREETRCSPQKGDAGGRVDAYYLWCAEHAVTKPQLWKDTVKWTLRSFSPVFLLWIEWF